MRKLGLSLALIWAGTFATAFEIEDHQRFGPNPADRVVRILSTADIAYFTPMIRSFLDRRPGTAIDYTVASSAQVTHAIREGQEPFDLVISSAMDLQTKLANDGFARRHAPRLDVPLPDWAVWNDMVFAFTQEPAAIVVSNADFADLPLPDNRQDLIRILRDNPERFRGRVGTYDIRESGLGYLYATQDTRASDTYWRLTEVMGALDTKLFCCSSDMIDGVGDGSLAVAYNVLSSYATSRTDTARYTVILPSDFTTVMLRTVVIPLNAPAPDSAGEFLDHMLKQAFASQGPFAIARALPEDRSEASLHRIRLGPGLLVYLDQLKRRSFLREWTNAILQE